MSAHPWLQLSRLISVSKHKRCYEKMSQGSNFFRIIVHIVCLPTVFFVVNQGLNTSSISFLHLVQAVKSPPTCLWLTFQRCINWWKKRNTRNSLWIFFLDSSFFQMRYAFLTVFFLLAGAVNFHPHHWPHNHTKKRYAGTWILRARMKGFWRHLHVVMLIGSLTRKGLGTHVINLNGLQ